MSCNISSSTEVRYILGGQLLVYSALSIKSYAIRREFRDCSSYPTTGVLMQKDLSLCACEEKYLIEFTRNYGALYLPFKKI